ncbi:protein RETICULATA-RELATED 4, chloroplastic-like [Impatiens glandulifera]|uniref:protein RETICULATA-RELATED 4, chloroplastic-like n=1 Tax=Impatiens glandulifera TaxID=253017 RepID=UPI001FB10A24|nr:protein RETICULATA-RELATED 4, chloroplastic-like [Impatiens glandulifera]
MSISAGFAPSNNLSSGLSRLDFRRQSLLYSPPSFNVSLPNAGPPSACVSRRPEQTTHRLVLAFSGGNGIGGDNWGKNGGSGGGNDDDGKGGEEEEDGEGFRGNKEEAILAIAEIGRSLDSIPKDLAAGIQSGRIPPSIVHKYTELEKSPLFRWLMQFGGFRERLLADDLFFAKLGMECGVGIITKTAAEYEKRRENFFKEIEIVLCDVVMAIIADFMLVYLPAPTVSLKPSLSIGAGSIASFFHHCPDNAFQIALGGNSYSTLQRIGAIMRNGAKLFAVGTTSSLIGTTVTNAFINAKKAANNNSSEDEIENVPVLATSVAYGVYMSVSANLRYQVVAGVIEQRFLEPIFHKHKLMLSAMCFAFRTGNTFLGSLLWVDYARWVGIQKAHEIEKLE